MAVGDIIQATFGCRFGDQLGLNVRHYRSVNTIGGVVTLQALADEMAADFDNIYPTVLSGFAEFRGVMVQKIFPGPMGMPVVSSLAPVQGIVAGEPLPRQVSGLISFRTAFAGRRFRGRSYIPFPAEASNDADSTPVNAYLTQMGVLALEFLQPRSVTEGAFTEQFQPTLWHRDTMTDDPILTATVNDAWATQRRRGSFGRPNPLTGGVVIIGP
jgi:hypothetical protein